MKNNLVRIFSLFILLILSAQSRGQITIGTADPGTGNAFPFTIDGFAVNNRYQQVYAASNFGGPVSISGITFFNTQLPGAIFETANYTFRLSTSNFTVNNLNIANLNANPGPDAKFFATVPLTGLTGSNFTISGVPFPYNPAHGDLLVDITRTGQVVNSSSGHLDTMNGTSGGLFSRAHNYDSAFENFGLVTRFTVVPEPSTLFLLGIGAISFLGYRKAKSRG
jgi:PEP-CTERM motif